MTTKSKLERISLQLHSNERTIIGKEPKSARGGLFLPENAVEYKNNSEKHFRMELGQKVDFWVAPKEALYDAAQLQQYLEGLIDGIEADEEERFELGENNCDAKRQMYLWYGSLEFHEKIGSEKIEIKRELILNDAEISKHLENKEFPPQQTEEYSLSLKLGNNCRSKLRDITPGLSNRYSNGKIESVITEKRDITRKIFLRVFPCEAILNEIRWIFPRVQEDRALRAITGIPLDVLDKYKEGKSGLILDSLDYKMNL